MTNQAHSFAPVFDEHARVLVLGSMPGQASLNAQQYYAHPRNAFWPIMAELCGFSAELPYAQRLEQLKAHHIALWDVLERCVRPGSLDADIDPASEQANALAALIESLPNLHTVAFNGRKAEQSFRKHVRPQLKNADAHRWLALPSTSPAHASMRFAEKLGAWRAIQPHALCAK